MHRLGKAETEGSNPSLGSTYKTRGTKMRHELTKFKPCTFGDGGFYYHDNADRAVCSCGWISAASQDKTALVALFEIHTKREDAGDDPRGKEL